MLYNLEINNFYFKTKKKESDFVWTQMFDSADKDFEAAIIHISK